MRKHRQSQPRKCHGYTPPTTPLTRDDLDAALHYLTSAYTPVTIPIALADLPHYTHLLEDSGCCVSAVLVTIQPPARPDPAEEAERLEADLAELGDLDDEIEPPMKPATATKLPTPAPVIKIRAIPTIKPPQKPKKGRRASILFAIGDQWLPATEAAMALGVPIATIYSRSRSGRYKSRSA